MSQYQPRLTVYCEKLQKDVTVAVTKYNTWVETTTCECCGVEVKVYVEVECECGETHTVQVY